MVAAHVLISLCAAGLTAAAPQLFTEPRAVNSRLGSSPTANKNTIVTNVVTALQPTIAEAVANALRSLRTPPAKFDAERAQFEAEFARRELTARPEYSFNYQVRSDQEGTYIHQEEARDGDDVTGNYGYIDPTGSLVTVNYKAGLDGFSQTLDKQENFLRRGPEKLAKQAKLAAPAKPADPAPQSSRIDEAALISQILKALQPQIQASVNSALG